LIFLVFAGLFIAVALLVLRAYLSAASMVVLAPLVGAACAWIVFAALDLLASELKAAYERISKAV